MILEVTDEEVRNITDAALLISVILARACLPAVVIIDVSFPRWVFEAQGPSRNDRDGVLLVGDANKCIQLAVDEIGELLVSYLKRWRGGIGMGQEQLDGDLTHAGQSISIELDGTFRHIELQVDGLDEGKSSA